MTGVGDDFAIVKLERAHWRNFVVGIFVKWNRRIDFAVRRVEAARNETAELVTFGRPVNDDKHNLNS